MGTDIHQVIERLKEERDSISIAIMALERISQGNRRKRGRPRKAFEPLSTEMQQRLGALFSPTHPEPAKRLGAGENGSN